MASSKDYLKYILNSFLDRTVFLLCDDVENREFLRDLPEAMYKELPAPTKKK